MLVIVFAFLIGAVGLSQRLPVPNFKGLFDYEYINIFSAL